MKFYDFLEHFEKRPFMYLGNEAGIKVLNSFILGLQIAGNKSFFIDKKHRYPNFGQFTTWIGGKLNYKYENSSGNWSWLLEQKYKSDKLAFEKFFEFLNEFKNNQIQAIEINVNKKNIKNIILYKLNSSKSLFCLSLSKNGKIIEENADMTGKILIPKIEKKFKVKIKKKDLKKSKLSKKKLIKYRLI